MRRETGGYLLAIEPAQVDLLRAETGIRLGLAARTRGDHAAAQNLLTDALTEWNAEPLCGLPGPYADQQRRRLAELRLTAVLAWVDMEFELGRYERVLPELIGLRSTQPLHEQVAGRLMTALSATGRQAEALKVYTDTRTALITELGIEPSLELNRTHTAVLRGQCDAILGSNGAPANGLPSPEDAGHWPAAVTTRIGSASSFPADPVRCVLPTSRHHLVGRDAELQTLMAEAPGQPPHVPRVDVIYGMPGVGKTALAVEATHRLAAQYPDGQFYLNLRGSEVGGKPTTVEEALADLLCACGLTQLPAERSRLAALWRSALVERHVIVVLDDARDADQVRELMPPNARSRVLVTGPDHLLGLDATTVTILDGLSVPHSTALLRTTAGEATRISDRTAQEIAALCQGLPAALRAVGSRLQHRSAWGTDQILDRLRNRPHAMPELAALMGRIGDAYERLARPDRELLRAIADGGSGPVDPVLACQPLGLSKSEVLDGCDRLCDASLLLIAGTGTVQVHPLVHAHVKHAAHRD